VTEREPLPADVCRATELHLAVLDTVAPGLVDSLYLTGSVTLGDYRQGRSDIDFMAFTSRQVTDPEVVAQLAEVHALLLIDLRAALPGTGHYDGNYVALGPLPAVPDDEPPMPHVVDGTFYSDEANGQLTPATWAEFAKYAIAIRGPERGELGISVSPDRLGRWLLGNLNAYWKRRAVDGLEMLHKLDPSDALPGEVVAWDALGAARLHYTLATGDFPSKTAAGEYAIGLFPRYSKVVSAALAWRATGAGDFTYAEWGSCAELILDIIDDANRHFASSGAA
jgi:hypothetical protein